MLVDGSAVRPTIGRTLKLSLKFRAGLDQPAVSQRHEEDRVDLGVDHILPARHETKRAETAGEDWDGLFGIRILGSSPS